MIHDNELFDSLIQSLPDIVYKINPEGRFTFVSNSIIKLGYDPGDLIGTHFSSIIHPDSYDDICRDKVLPRLEGQNVPANKSPKLFDERRTGSRITRSLRIKLQPRDGGAGPVEGEVISLGLYAPGGEETGQLIGTIGIIRDLSDMLTIEKVLHLTERFYRNLIDYSSDIFSIIATDGTILYISDSVRSLLGYLPIDLIGENQLTYIHPDDEEIFTRIISDDQVKSPGGTYSEYRFLHADWSWRYIESSARMIIDEQNEQVSTLLYSRDITQRKRVEQELRDEREQLARSLAEKDILLREIHHRVKNNFQIITSLLQIQARGADASSLTDVFGVCVQRIRAMALVHDKMYQAIDLSRVDFTAYVRALVSELEQAAMPIHPSISITVDAEDISLNIEQAIPCGMIINEVLTDAIRNASPEPVGVAPRAIDVRMRGESDRIILEINDPGAGIRNAESSADGGSVGLTLIRMLVEQLKGTIDARTDAGTGHRISFPLAGNG